VWPLRNDRGVDPGTLRIVRTDKDVSATLGGDGSVTIALAAGTGDQGNNVVYEVCAAPGQACARATIRVRTLG
jgi:hypothetical protein